MHPRKKLLGYSISIVVVGFFFITNCKKTPSSLGSRNSALTSPNVGSVWMSPFDALLKAKGHGGLTCTSAPIYAPGTKSDGYLDDIVEGGYCFAMSPTVLPDVAVTGATFIAIDSKMISIGALNVWYIVSGTFTTTTTSTSINQLSVGQWGGVPPSVPANTTSRTYNLKSGQEYQVRAYAKNSSGLIGYGPVVSVTP